MSFEGKTVIVTGAGQGIGREVSLGFAKEGASVVAADINAEAASGTTLAINQAGGDALNISVDVTRAAEAERLVAAAVDKFGSVDVLVNCAGVRARNDLLDIPEDEWDWVMAVNVKGTFTCSQAAARQMVKDKAQGAIVNIASVASFTAIPRILHYVTSKGAVAMMTKGLALELAAHNIRVNAVAPGPIATEMIKDRLDDPEQTKWLLGKIPLGRVGETWEVFQAIRFLCSEDAGFVTGAILNLDGGWTIH